MSTASILYKTLPAVNMHSENVESSCRNAANSNAREFPDNYQFPFFPVPV